MLKHLLIAFAYILLALAVALVLPGIVPGLGVAGGWLAGAVVVVAGGVLHESYTRIDAADTVARQMYRLHKDMEKLRAEADHLRKEVPRLDAAVTALADGDDSKAKEDLDRVVSEVRVLQKLIEKLSSHGGDSTPRPAADGTAPVSANLDESQILDIVREGLKRDRVDLYLQPIVSLPQRKTRFYECFSRIRSEDGSLMLPDQYISVAQREGHMGAIDNLLLFRCVQLVRRAQTRKHAVGFFCNISANTLEDRAFFADFVDFMATNQELARNLIFEFSHEDVEAHGSEIEEYIARLGRLGFYFSMDRVRELSKLDIPGLARMRFKYIKIDNAQLLHREGASGQDAAAEGEGASDTIVGVNVSALKRVLDIHGIDLIAEKIESEEDLIELLDYRIDYGQGYLFGEPRPSKEA